MATVAPAAAATAALPRASGSELRWAFAFAVVAFAWLRFSENRADNDLWGHVLYGERILALGHLERTDALSWTAAGAPWINHEIGAELTLALVHRATGGPGLWLFMIAMATVTVTWACREGMRVGAHATTTLALLAVSTNFIASGYAVRPQLFTMLGFVALLLALRRFLAGQHAWGWALPPLFAVWVNVHGGYLAGWLVACVAIVADTFYRWVGRGVRPSPHGLSGRDPQRRLTADRPPQLGIRSAVLLASTLALAVNPDGVHLLTWTVQSVQLPRPFITEWHPMPWSLAAAPFYAVLIATVLAWSLSSRPRELWSAAVLALLAAAAILQQRHAPLFGLANLIFTPPHLESALQRLANACANLIACFRRPLVQRITAVILALAGGNALVASVRAPREHPFTIEVPRDTYPAAAIAFMRAHALTGKTITFFDWGQQVLWELPENPVSFDGRLDTVYSRTLMDAHWRLYAGEAPGAALDLTPAAVALLATESGGVDVLRRAGWQLVYRDPLASVLVRNPSGFSPLRGVRLPVLAGAAAVSGRARFPDTPPSLARPKPLEEPTATRTR